MRSSLTERMTLRLLPALLLLLLLLLLMLLLLILPLLLLLLLLVVSNPLVGVPLLRPVVVEGFSSRESGEARLLLLLLELEAPPLLWGGVGVPREFNANDNASPPPPPPPPIVEPAPVSKDIGDVDLVISGGGGDITVEAAAAVTALLDE